MRSHEEVPNVATMTETQMRAVSETLFQVWNTHDVEGILEHLTDDVVWAEPTLEEPARGKEAVAADLKDTFTAFPDLRLLEDFQLFPSVEQQASVATWTLMATMTGPSQVAGVPPTGKSVRISGTTISRFRDGLISEYTTHYDSLNFMQQVGLLPKTNGLPFKAVVMADILAGKAKQVLHR